MRYADTLQSLTQHLDSARLTKLPNAFNPPNRGTLSETEVDIAMAILCDEGVPLAWVPRPVIVSELVKAPDSASRLAFLAIRIPEIVTDCAEALDEVTGADLKAQVERITKVSGDTPLVDACVLSPAIAALKDFDPDNSPLPVEFGRHATVHWADPQHYTAANAAIAVMLATSFLREAQASGW